ncbi:hypothetical protein SCUP515_09192 [Seiridium cupressi]
MDHAAHNWFCVCSACRGEATECVSLKALHQHTLLVCQLLATDPSTTAVYDHDQFLGHCHTILLAFFSNVLGREIQSTIIQGNRVKEIHLTNHDDHNNEMKISMRWMYTGCIHFDRENYQFKGTNLERLWLLATDLEMPEYANCLMRMIIGKYTKYKDISGHKECFGVSWYPFEPVYWMWQGWKTYEFDALRSAKLVRFYKQLFRTQKPFSHRARTIYSRHSDNEAPYLRLELDWVKFMHDPEDMEFNEDFKEWIESLGGIEKETCPTNLPPTDPRQWHHYMVLGPQYGDRLQKWPTCQPGQGYNSEGVTIRRGVRKEDEPLVDDNFQIVAYDPGEMSLRRRVRRELEWDDEWY